MTFAHYLRQLGRNSSLLSTEERKVLYAAYRSDYKKQYQANYRKRFKRLEVSFTASEYRLLEKIANQYGVKPNQLVKSFYEAYQTSQVALPPLSTLEKTEMLLRRSANNINQVIYSCHVAKAISTQNLIDLTADIEAMKQTLYQLYRAPKINFSPLNLNDH